MLVQAAGLWLPLLLGCPGTLCRLPAWKHGRQPGGQRRNRTVIKQCPRRCCCVDRTPHICMYVSCRSPAPHFGFDSRVVCQQGNAQTGQSTLLQHAPVCAGSLLLLCTFPGPQAPAGRQPVCLTRSQLMWVEVAQGNKGYKQVKRVTVQRFY